jgi:hypothetical protein
MTPRRWNAFCFEGVARKHSAQGAEAAHCEADLEVTEPPFSGQALGDEHHEQKEDI